MLSRSRIGRRYGWKPSRPDHRNVKFVPPKKLTLPPRIDSLTAFIPAWDQGSLGSCTAHGTGRIWAHRYSVERGTKTFLMPSRLFLYYGERQMEGTISEDAGAAVADGLQVLSKLGIPPETDWPYDITQFATRPPQNAYDDAIQFEALQYQSVDQSIMAIKQAIAAGNPVTLGFTVFQSFEEPWATQGMMPMPHAGEDILGGHCVCVDGYDDAIQCLKVFNSWGPEWGGGDGLEPGAFHMPYANIRNMDDFWVLTQLKPAA